VSDSINMAFLRRACGAAKARSAGGISRSARIFRPLWMLNESFFGVRLRPLWSGRLFDPRKLVHYSPLMILGFGLVLAHPILPHLLVSS
jgi:hypothetical protein